MILNEDLPEGWEVVASPLERDEADTLERAVTGDLSERHEQSWDAIRHAETGQRIILRVSRRASGASVAITAALLIGADTESGVQAGELRRAPLLDITRAVNARLQATHAAYRVGIALANDKWQVGAPLGPNDGTETFYARVAAAWLHAYNAGNPNPTRLIRELGITSLPTAQRWVATARKLGFIPPGVTGRPGGKAKTHGDDQ